MSRETPPIEFDASAYAALVDALDAANAEIEAAIAAKRAEIGFEDLQAKVARARDALQRRMRDEQVRSVYASGRVVSESETGLRVDTPRGMPVQGQ